MQTHRSVNTLVISWNLLAGSMRLCVIKKILPHMLEKVEPRFSEHKENESDESIL